MDENKPSGSGFPVVSVTVVVILVAVIIAAFALKQNRMPVTPRTVNEQSAGAKESPAVPPDKKKQLPKLVDLGADKCIPCKMMMPVLEELKQDYKGKLDVEFIDVWKNESAGRAYNIRVIPTQIFFDENGKELFRHEGFFPKEDILAKWKELGKNLSPQTE